MSKNESTCQTLACSAFIKMRGTDKAYQEALEAASKFNKGLFISRKTRIPFIDSQTRVAQINSLLWYQPYQREKGAKGEQIYTYPLKSWVKRRRLLYENDSNVFKQSQFEVQQINNENSNSTDSIQPIYKLQQQQQQPQAVEIEEPKVLIDDWSLVDDPFDNFDENNDNDSDDDFEETKRKKKKGKGSGKKRSEINPDDKPFICDKCGVKYKTKPGLTYHVQKMHSNNHHSTNANVHLSHSNSHNSDVQIEAVITHTRTSSSLKQEFTVNDENTNSLYDSVFDESSHNAQQIVKYASNSKVCATCNLGSVDHDPRRQIDQLISCCECPRLFHPACLNFSPNMVSAVKKYKWQCIECKKCVICGNSENDDKLLFCDDCDRGYHMYCLTPALIEAPNGDWSCRLCINIRNT